jgi:hypothetical protein
MNFIKAHLVASIKRFFKEYDGVMKIDGSSKFIYLDEPIKTNKNNINRINAWFPFYQDEVVNSGWHELTGGEIMEIYKKLKSNKIYIIKNIDKKFYKIRRKV